MLRCDTDVAGDVGRRVLAELRAANAGLTEFEAYVLGVLHRQTMADLADATARLGKGSQMARVTAPYVKMCDLLVLLLLEDRRARAPAGGGPPACVYERDVA